MALDRVLHYGQPARSEAQVRQLRDLFQRAMASHDTKDWEAYSRAQRQMLEVGNVRA